jgi:hypothetical protein
VAVAGFAVLTAGLAMTVLPGPALIVIPAGLAILAREFPWARRLLLWLKGLGLRLWTRIRGPKQLEHLTVEAIVAVPVRGGGWR